MSALTERALTELLLTGGVCGVLGVQVVLRRLAFFTETLGHVTFLGIVAAAVVGADIKIGAGIAAVGAVAVMGRGGVASRSHHQRSGAMLSGALALGVVLISTRPGFSKDLSAALVGSPLTAGTGDITVAAITAVLVAVTLTLAHKELVLAAFDPSVTRALGYPTRLIDGGLLALLAVTVVTAVPAVGATLPLALLVGPAASALLWTRRIIPATLMGGVLGAASGAAGLALSLHYRVATAAGTAVICGALFIVAATTTLVGRARRPDFTDRPQVCDATAT
ncbi:metal ABC transporter permease [Actinoallomurus sp. NPDC052274]|uniref:metal ABC transporter permease n=1 Tax=Actinoallomurus sp. NPDC052274 TaxID=3155420 RepID=UPI003432CF98